MKKPKNKGRRDAVVYKVGTTGIAVLKQSDGTALTTQNSVAQANSERSDCPVPFDWERQAADVARTANRAAAAANKGIDAPRRDEIIDITLTNTEDNMSKDEQKSNVWSIPLWKITGKKGIMTKVGELADKPTTRNLAFFSGGIVTMWLLNRLRGSRKGKK